MNAEHDEMPEPVEPQPAPEPPTMEDSLRNLLRAAREVAKNAAVGCTTEEVETLMLAIEEMEEWTDQSNDPRENGWVGQNGLP
jgi:hypothetical protein